MADLSGKFIFLGTVVNGEYSNHNFVEVSSGETLRLSSDIVVDDKLKLVPADFVFVDYKVRSGVSKNGKPYTVFTCAQIVGTVAKKINP